MTRIPEKRFSITNEVPPRSVKYCEVQQTTTKGIRKKRKNDPTEKYSIPRKEDIILKSSMHVTSKIGYLWHEGTLTSYNIATRLQAG
jgi:hypothetical protein